MPVGPAAYQNGRRIEAEVGPEKAAQLRAMLASGKSAKDMVPVIQGEWNLMTDKKPNTVLTMLHRYSRSYVKTETIQRVMATVKNSKHVKVSSLEDLAQLCEKQKGRLKAALKMEKTMNGLLTQQGSNEIRLLAGMLKDLALLQIETGLLPRAPKTVQGFNVDPQGRATHFGWVENEESLLQRLTLETLLPGEGDYDHAPTVEHEPDEEPDEDGVY